MLFTNDVSKFYHTFFSVAMSEFIPVLSAFTHIVAGKADMRHSQNVLSPIQFVHLICKADIPKTDIAIFSPMEYNRKKHIYEIHKKIQVVDKYVQN